VQFRGPRPESRPISPITECHASRSSYSSTSPRSDFNPSWLISTISSAEREETPGSAPAGAGRRRSPGRRCAARWRWQLLVCCRGEGQGEQHARELERREAGLRKMGAGTQRAVSGAARAAPANAAAAPVSLIAVLGQVSSTAHAWGMDRAQHAVKLCRRRWGPVGCADATVQFSAIVHTGGPGRGAAAAAGGGGDRCCCVRAQFHGDGWALRWTPWRAENGRGTRSGSDDADSIDLSLSHVQIHSPSTVALHMHAPAVDDCDRRYSSAATRGAGV